MFLSSVSLDDCCENSVESLFLERVVDFVFVFILMIRRGKWWSEGFRVDGVQQR